MKEDKTVPQLRFPEFTDAWKQCKLSDLVNVIDGDRGKNYPTEADFEPHGHTLFLNASNVTIDGFLFDTNQFITEEKSNSMGSGKIIKDDIIITSRGSLGHIAWYNDSVQQVMPHLRINSGMLILRNKANVKTSYLHQFMKSDKGKAQIVFMSFGSAQPQLTKKGVESFTVNYPMDTEEQIKIGAFFSKLDNTITLQQRKFNSLQKLKKGLLQKMFPKKGENIPEIRFPEFSDAWKQRKVGDLLVERREMVTEDNEYPLMAFIANEGVAPKGDRFDRSALVKNADSKKYKRTKYGDFIYSSNNLESGSIGLNKYGKASISPVYSIFYPTNLADSDFIGRYFLRKDFIGQMIRWRQGVVYGQWKIPEADFLNIDIYIPSKDEQEKIGQILDKVDNTITLQQRWLFYTHKQS